MSPSTKPSRPSTASAAPQRAPSSPGLLSWTRAPPSPPACATAGPPARSTPARLPRRGSHAGGAPRGGSHGSPLPALCRPRRAQGVVAAVGLVAGGRVAREVRTFATTTAGLLELAAWLAENGCTHVAMEATGVYWKPVWHVLAEGGLALVLANAAQVKGVPGRKTDVNDAAWLAELLAHGLVRA